MEIDKIENTIAQKVGIIKEVKEILENVKDSSGKTVKMKITTNFREMDNWGDIVAKHRKNKIEFNKETLITVLENSIKKEQEYINKLIDMEIENRRNK